MIVLCGKSGSGKTSIAKILNERGYRNVVTYTTRPIRKNETQDVTYHFITKDEFIKKQNDHEFVETTSYNTVEGEWYYGSCLEDYDDKKVIIMNPDGLDKIRKLPYVNPVIFYIYTDVENLRNRLMKRGDGLAEIERRLSQDNLDFMFIRDKIDFMIRNDGNLHLTNIADMIIYLHNKVRSDIGCD